MYHYANDDDITMIIVIIIIIIIVCVVVMMYGHIMLTTRRVWGGIAPFHSHTEILDYFVFENIFCFKNKEKHV